MAIRSVIQDIAYYLPDDVVTSEELEARWDGWSAQRFVSKSGIRARRVSRPDQFASDLAVEAANQLLEQTELDRRSVDVLVMCTQSPDYLVPTTACIVQARLGLSNHCLAFDMNQGCSGYIYALAVVRGLLETGQGRKALLLTALSGSASIARSTSRTWPTMINSKRWHMSQDTWTSRHGGASSTGTRTNG